MIRFENVSFHYGGEQGTGEGVDNIDLVIKSGEVVVLCGASGCGKTTLTRLINGLAPHFFPGELEGEVWVDDVCVSTASLSEASKHVGSVFQNPKSQFFNVDTTGELVFGCENQGMPRDEMHRRLEKTRTDMKLDALMGRNIFELSGGEKQQIACGSIYTTQPDVYVLDEPSSNLDRKAIVRLHETLEKIKAAGKTIVISEHRLYYLMDLADRFLYLDDGIITKSFSPDDLRGMTSVIITHDPELILQCCTHILHVENGRVMSIYPLNEDGVQRIRWYFLSESEENTSKKREKLGMFGKVLQYTGRWKKYVYGAVGFMIFGALCSTVPYICIYDLLNRLLDGEALTPEGTLPTVLLVLVFGVLFALTYTYGLQLSHRAAYHTLENLRISLQEKLEKQPLGNIHEMGIGTVKKHFNDDIESIELMLAHVIPEGIANVSVSAVILLILVAADWQMAVLTLILLGFGFAASRQMYDVGMDRMGNYFAASKRLNNTIIEYVSGMEVVRVFNREGESGKRFEESVHGYRDFALAWYRVCWPWMALYSSLFANVVLYSLPFGSLMVILGYLPLSRYVLALCLSFALGPPLQHTLALIGTIPRVNFKIQALEKALDRPPLSCGAEAFAGTDHSVHFEQVRFAYKSDEVLKGITFTAAEGEMTALVGESGSGKSTVARLLAHYYDVGSGEISIGGQSIRRMSLDALSREVAYVSQELFLFNKSILENIRVGKPDASDEEVKAAARKAQCEEFILQLPDGYDTQAGLAGNKLSGGQKQRIAFARVILKDAPIIVLDEATASVDADNERLIQQAMSELCRDKTVLVIAHRLNTIAGADRILVLERGGVMEQGSHAELMAKGGAYCRMVRLQREMSSWSGEVSA